MDTTTKTRKGGDRTAGIVLELYDNKKQETVSLTGVDIVFPSHDQQQIHVTYRDGEKESYETKRYSWEEARSEWS